MMRAAASYRIFMSFAAKVAAANKAHCALSDDEAQRSIFDMPSCGHGNHVRSVKSQLLSKLMRGENRFSNCNGSRGAAEIGFAYVIWALLLFLLAAFVDMYRRRD